MSAIVEAYMLDQLTSSQDFIDSAKKKILASDEFINLATYKLITNPATPGIIDERVRQHAIPTGLVFVASTLLGSILYWKFYGSRKKKRAQS